MEDDRRIERRLRRQAHQIGLMLVKSRARAPQRPDYGTFMLVDAETNCVVDDPGMTLDEVASWLGLEGLGECACLCHDRDEAAASQPA